MKYDIEARNRLHRVYEEILIKYSGNKLKMLELFKDHQLMIPADNLSLTDRQILAQACADIFNRLAWAASVTKDDNKIKKLNELGNNIDPMGNYWWGLYDFTYKEFIPSYIYEYIHDNLINMYESLFGD